MNSLIALQSTQLSSYIGISVKNKIFHTQDLCFAQT